MARKQLVFEEVEAEIIEDKGIVIATNPGTISANFAELEASIKSRIKPFAGDIITQDTIKDGKKVRAYLRSISKDLNDRRKALEKEFTAPLTAFKAEIKRIDGIILTEVDNIDSQVKAFEDSVKKEKSDLLKGLYEDYATALVDVVPFEKILDDSWLNASEKHADTKLYDKVDRIAEDWETFQSLDIPMKEQAEIVFFETLSLRAAREEATRLEEHAQAIKTLHETVAESLAPDKQDKEAVEADGVQEDAPEQYALVLDCDITTAKDMARLVQDQGIKVTIRRVK